MILAEPVLLSLLLISDLTSNRVVVNILVLYDKYHNLGRFLLNFEQKIDKSMISILYDAKRLQNAFIFLLFFFTWEFWWTRLLGKDKEGNKQKILKLAKVIVFMGGGSKKLTGVYLQSGAYSPVHPAPVGHLLRSQRSPIPNRNEIN